MDGKDGWINMDEWMNEWKDGWMGDGQMDGRIDGCRIGSGQWIQE